MSSVRRLGIIFSLLLCLAGEISAVELEMGEHLNLFGVAPSIFHLTIKSQNTPQSFRVINKSDIALRFQITVQYWDLDEQNTIRILPPTEQSLDQWILITPVTFTVPAGQEQVVRFSIMPRVQPEAGEHRAIIYVATVPDPARDVNEQGQMVSVKMGIGVYGNVESITRTGEVHAITVEAGQQPTVMLYDITSAGNAHVRLKGYYSIWRATAYPGPEQTPMLPNFDPQNPPPLPDGALEMGELPQTPILPGTRRTLRQPVKSELPPGDYILDVNGALEDLLLDQAVPFTVPDQ